MITANGQFVPLSLDNAYGNQQQVTSPNSFYNSSGSGAVSANTVAPVASQGRTSALWYIFAVLLILVAIKFASEHEKSPMRDSISFAGISVYNYIVIGLMAMLFIVTAKIVFNKWQVPGLTDIVNMG